MASEVYFQTSSGEIIEPGTPEHEFAETLLQLNESQQKKVLQIIRMVGSGDLRAEEVMQWNQQQRREFLASVPEADA